MTHTKLFIQTDKTLPLDQQINNYQGSTLVVKQVTLVSFYMSTTLQSLVVFEGKNDV